MRGNLGFAVYCLVAMGLLTGLAEVSALILLCVATILKLTEGVKS